jgi:DnaK suppressor protein
MAKLNDMMKKAVLENLRKEFKKTTAELKLLSAETRVRLQRDGHKAMELEFVSSAPDVDLSRNIPSLIKIKRKLEETLLRVEKTSEYGACLRCGEEIPVARLKEVPFTEYCITCKTSIEEQEKKIRKGKGYVKGRLLYT